MMDKIIDLIISWVQRNLKKPRFYAVLAGLLIVLVLIFPYIDANYFFYNRIEKRVSVMQSLSEIDMGKVAAFPALQEEYDAIISDIENQRERSIFGAGSSQPYSNDVQLFKFLSGGAIAWIITLCVPFMDTFKDRKTKFLAFLLLALFGGVLGWVGYIVPTLFNPWINYLGYPILQLIALIALTIKPKQG